MSNRKEKDFKQEADKMNNYGISEKSSIRSKTLHKRNHTGETALHLACKRQDLTLVKALIKKGIQVNCPDYAGWTALHKAASTGERAVVELLLEAGAQVNVRNMDGDTPLHDAARSGSYQVAKLLLEHGSNPQDKNVGGLCAVDMAESRDMRELLRTYQLSAPGVSCLECHSSTKSCVCEKARALHRTVVRQSAPKATTLILSEIKAKLTQVESLSLAGSCHTERLTALWDIHSALVQVMSKQHMAKDNLAHMYWSVPDCLRKRVLKKQLVSLASAQRKLVDTIQKQMQVVEEYVRLCNSGQRHTSCSPAPSTAHHQQSVVHTVLPSSSQSSIMVPAQDNQALRAPLAPAQSNNLPPNQELSLQVPSGARLCSDHGVSVEQSQSCAVEVELCSPSILESTSEDVDGLALLRKVRVLHVTEDDELVPNVLMDQYWEKMLRDDSWTF